MKSKELLVQLNDEKLIQNLRDWDMDISCLYKEECNEEELLSSRLINIAGFYFANVDATYEELKNKFVYEEALILLDMMNGICLLNAVSNHKYLLIDDVEFVKEHNVQVVEEKYYDSLINKLKNLTEMQVHVAYKICKNFWNRKKACGTFTKEEVEKAFNIVN